MNIVTPYIPPGIIFPFCGSSAPQGYFKCDGSAVSRATYSVLFGIVGTTYGAGDGSTTFNLPDLRGRFPLGKSVSGTGSVLGQSGGSIDHGHTGVSHYHTVNLLNHQHYLNGHLHSSSTTHYHTVAANTHNLTGGVASGYAQINLGTNIVYQNRISTSSWAALSLWSGTVATSTATPTNGAPLWGTTDLVAGNSGGNINTDAVSVTTGSPNNYTYSSSPTPTDSNVDYGNTSTTDPNNPPFVTANYIIKY